jgi:ATP-binding cassette, subfamily C, type I secretion system permease/ATPase
MTGWISSRWQALNRQFLSGHADSSDLAAELSATGRSFRMMLQSGVLAVGAYLVINQQASAGVIIASSILSARALAPVDLAISHWRGFVSARQARERLNKLLVLLPAYRAPTPLPRPQHNLSVDGISASPPDVQRAVVHELTFALKAGSGLGVIGPSASGKSSLARVLVGLWTPARGTIRLDGATLDQWIPDELGRHIGYLPQDVELIEGTVAENISRFDPGASADAIIGAAKAAGVHELVLGLPLGYDTPIGEQGSALSAGQQQRVALARALYRDPFLVVLDEPNSNLDAEGDEALTQAILGARARGAIVVVVAHRPSALSGVDHVLALNGGRQQAFGPKDEVLAKVLRREAVVAAPKIVHAAAQG